MPFPVRPRYTWRLRTRSLPLGRRTLLAGILNVTPDSFSDGGRFSTPQAALDHALQMLDEGADLIDLGGESTRPDSAPVSEEEEQRRVLPVLRAILKARKGAIISVDTYHASTAQAALDAGAEVINDVSGLLWDREMAEVIAREQPGAILMHTRGAPRMWNNLPPLPHADVLPMVVAGLAHILAVARKAAIPRTNIVLDPGFGFGKMGDENFTLLAHFAELHQFALPLLAGVSRKRFLSAHLPHSASSDDLLLDLRLEATTAAHVAAILSGAHLLRVHDVAAARAAASVADAILNCSEPQDDEENPSRVRKHYSGEHPS
jgi:dihydropteroate synthase